MSRLDSFIRRLEAQRRMLDWAADAIAGREGAVLELGLGNGRTYDHLREILPGRAIHAFERKLAANPGSIPPAPFLILGDMAETLPAFRDAHGPVAVLIHVDATSGRPEFDAEHLAWLPRRVAELAAPGGLVLSGWHLADCDLVGLPLPEGVPEGRYFAYRRRD